jgi:hypothetical protein
MIFRNYDQFLFRGIGGLFSHLPASRGSERIRDFFYLPVRTDVYSPATPGYGDRYPGLVVN